jgi:hypothetical protein
MKRYQTTLGKAVISAIAACSMLLPISVASADAPGISVKQGAGYTATKISHPNNSLGQDDGIINIDKNGNSTVADGDADRGQSYAWSSLGYGDWMYVGTCYSAMGSTLKLMASKMGTSYAKIKAGLDVLFNGELYLDNGENRSLLLKVNTKTGEMKVVVPPIQKATGANTNVNGYRAAVEFHDKLYFAAAAQGAPYLLEINPKDDSSKIVYQSGGVAPGISVGIRGLAVMNNELIASMIGAQGAYIVASSDPSAGEDSFRTIATQQDLLNYPAYHYTDNIFGGAIWDMVAFNNRLYITVVTGTANNKQSFALFRGEEGADGKWMYTPLVGDPADGARYEYGFGASRSGAANMVVYKNHLYIGGYNDPMVALPDVLSTMKFKNLYDDMSNPVNLWRMDADENFELVAGSDGDKYFGAPKGTIDGKTMRAGLGAENDISRHLNQYVWRMQSYDGKMYAGTFDISDLSYPVTQFANGDILHRTPEEWKKQIEYIKKFLETTETDASGTSTYALIDGSDADGGAADAATADDIAKVQRMESLMQEMQGDLESKQTDDAAPMALDDAEEYTIENREDFQKMLEELLALYRQVRPRLPDYVVEQLDKWLTQENVENFTYFVGVCRYLHYANSEKRGFDMVVTSDGLNFQTVTRNGFGDNNNHGLRVFAVTNSGLAVGTANPYHGAQVWLLNDGTEVKNASLTAGKAFAYDKYDSAAAAPNAAGLNVGINFNGNTVEGVEYDYKALTAGADYVVNEDGSGITLTSAFLNAQETGSTGSVVVRFNRGARVDFTVDVKDSTPDKPNPDNPVTPTQPSKPTTPTVQQGANAPADVISNTGSNVMGMIVAAAVLVLAGGAMLLLRRQRNK